MCTCRFSLVCVFVCVHAYVCVRASVYTRAHLGLYVCARVHACVRVCASTCVRVCVHLCMCALLPQRRCSGVHDAVLEHPLLKQVCGCAAAAAPCLLRAGASIVPGLATMSELCFNTQCAASICNVHSMPREQSKPTQTVFLKVPIQANFRVSWTSKLKLHIPSKLVLLHSACMVNCEICSRNATKGL
jgi:hypothetical protein